VSLATLVKGEGTATPRNFLIPHGPRRKRATDTNLKAFEGAPRGTWRRRRPETLKKSSGARRQSSNGPDAADHAEGRARRTPLRLGHQLRHRGKRLQKQGHEVEPFAQRTACRRGRLKQVGGLPRSRVALHTRRHRNHQGVRARRGSKTSRVKRAPRFTWRGLFFRPICPGWISSNYTLFRPAGRGARFAVKKIILFLVQRYPTKLSTLSSQVIHSGGRRRANAPGAEISAPMCRLGYGTNPISHRWFSYHLGREVSPKNGRIAARRTFRERRLTHRLVALKVSAAFDRGGAGAARRAADRQPGIRPRSPILGGQQEDFYRETIIRPHLGRHIVRLIRRLASRRRPSPSPSRSMASEGTRTRTGGGGATSRRSPQNTPSLDQTCAPTRSWCAKRSGATPPSPRSPPRSPKSARSRLAGKEVGQLLDEAESKIFQIRRVGHPQGIRGLLGIKPVTGRALFEKTRSPPQPGQFRPMSTGGGRPATSSSMKMTSGLQGGDLIIIAGRPVDGQDRPRAQHRRARSRSAMACRVAIFSMENELEPAGDAHGLGSIARGRPATRCAPGAFRTKSGAI